MLLSKNPSEREKMLNWKYIAPIVIPPSKSGVFYICVYNIKYSWGLTDVTLTEQEREANLKFQRKEIEQRISVLQHRIDGVNRELAYFTGRKAGTQQDINSLMEREMLALEFHEEELEKVKEIE